MGALTDTLGPHSILFQIAAKVQGVKQGWLSKLTYQYNIIDSSALAISYYGEKPQYLMSYTRLHHSLAIYLLKCRDRARLRHCTADCPTLQLPMCGCVL